MSRQRGVIEFAAVQVRQHVAHVQDADDVIDVFVVQRHAGVLAVGQRLADGGPVVVDIDAGDLVARYHDVLDAHMFEVHQVQQHRLVARGNHRAGLQHHGTQLLLGQCLRGAAFG